MSISAHQLLRDSTSYIHSYIERLPVFNMLANGEISIALYRRLLMAFSGFWGPVERHLQAFPAQGLWVPRQPGLHHDLINLGLSENDIEALPECSFAPRPESFGAALGVIYVLNGSRMGGAVIHKALSAKGHVPAECRTYFEADTQRLKSDWLEFVDNLNKNLGHERDIELACISAREVFLSLIVWINGQDIY